MSNQYIVGNPVISFFGSIYYEVKDGDKFQDIQDLFTLLSA